MNPDVERQQQKAKEFMSLLSLTLAIAGLPEAEPGKYFTESQLEARSMTIRTAYKIARQLVTHHSPFHVSVLIERCMIVPLIWFIRVPLIE